MMESLTQHFARMVESIEPSPSCTVVYHMYGKEYTRSIKEPKLFRSTQPGEKQFTIYNSHSSVTVRVKGTEVYIILVGDVGEFNKRERAQMDEDKIASLSYMQDAIRIGEAWYRKDTGKQTCPAHEKARSLREIIHPQTVAYSTQAHRKLAIAIGHWMYQYEYNWIGGVGREVVTFAIRDILPDSKKKEAWEMLKTLWRCGLVGRTGVIDPRSGKPEYQLWSKGDTK